MIVREGDLDDPQIVELLAIHAGGMLANSPVDACHFLDLSGLKAPDITFLACWEGETLLGIGALRRLGDGSGEIKSMRTAQAALGRGVGTAILRDIIERGRAEGLTSLKLETGTGSAFDAAHALYARHGFVACGPFGDYEATDFNRFYTLEIREQQDTPA